MARALSRVLVAVVVLAVLLVVADRGAAVLVARSVAQGLRTSQGLTSDPGVTFRGLPFLTQAAGGRYRQVDVTMTGVPTSGPLVIDRLDASLFGVSAQAAPALRGELTALPVDRAEADAFVSYASLQRAAGTMLGSQGVKITLRPGTAADRVAFTATVRSALGSLTVGGEARIVVSKGAVGVRLLLGTLTGIPEALRSQVAAAVALDGLVPELPFGFRVTGVTVGADGLQVRAAGTGLTIPV